MAAGRPSSVRAICASDLPPRRTEAARTSTSPSRVRSSSSVPTAAVARAAKTSSRLAPGAVLDVSGQWVNDSNKTPGEIVGGAYVDGGTVQLQTLAQSVSCSTAVCPAIPGAKTVPLVDLTGDVVLEDGVTIDVSSGGRVNERGVVQLDSAGRPIGHGGNVSLATYAGGFTPSTPPLPPTYTQPSARIVLKGSDGTAARDAAALSNIIHGYGFSGGGTLFIKTPEIQIGGNADPGSLALPASYFQGNAFGGYDLAAGSVSVADGEKIVLDQKNLLAGVDLLTSDAITHVGCCADDTCLWLFLDTTRSRTRRWCDMKVCGNRNKVRRFRQATDS